MKVKSGDKVRITNKLGSTVYKYIGKTDDWYYNKGWTRKFQNKKGETIIMHKDNLEQCEVEKV